MDKKGLITLEKARAYWWQIYCRCRQIEKELGGNSGRNHRVSLEDIKELRFPARNAQRETKKILWSYLKEGQTREQIYFNKGQVAGLKISPAWLWAYFGYILLASETFNRYQSEAGARDQFTTQEQLEFYDQSSTFFIQLLKQIDALFFHKGEARLNLGAMEAGNYIQFLRSLIFLIAEYCHLDVGIPRVLDIETCLRKSILLDTHWYLTQERYQDHTFHVIHVCLLGHFLLNCRRPEGPTLLEFMAQALDNQAGLSQQLMQNWFLAALWHDIGYSLAAEKQIWGQLQPESGPGSSNRAERPDDNNEEEMLKKLLTIRHRNLSELELQRARYGSSVPVHLIHEIETEKEEIHFLETQLNHWRKQRPVSPVNSPLNGPQAGNCYHTNPGAQSYDHVVRLLNTLPAADKPLEYFAPALAAIKNHQAGDQQQIVFGQEPLSFLLVLCDELQEWGQSRPEREEGRQAILSKMVQPGAPILAPRQWLEYLFVDIRLDNRQRRGIISRRGLNFSLVYKDAAEERFQPTAVWLLKSFNFQRISISREELEVTVALRHPICRDLDRLNFPDLSEFSLLRDYMRAFRRWQELQEWLENRVAVEWEFRWPDDSDDGKQEENTILRLNEFSHKKLLPHHPEAFFDELFEWRQEYLNGAWRKV